MYLHCNSDKSSCGMKALLVSRHAFFLWLRNIVGSLGVKNLNGTNKLRLNELVVIDIKGIRAFHYTIPWCNSYTQTSTNIRKSIKIDKKKGVECKETIPAKHMTTRSCSWILTITKAKCAFANPTWLSLQEYAWWSLLIRQ